MPEPVIKLKLNHRKFRDDPWNEFKRLREAGPVVKVKIPLMGTTWAATTFDSVNEVLKGTEHFARDPKNAGRKKIIPWQSLLPRSIFSVTHNMLGADGEQHRRLRSMVDHAFANRNIDAVLTDVEIVAEQQLEMTSAILKTQGHVDLIEHFARPFPLTVICELLGLPLQDRSKFRKWFEPFSTVSSAFSVFKIGSMIKNVTNYLQDQIALTRSRPHQGLLSELVKAKFEGDQLSEQELLSMAFLLLAAGHETTVHLISNCILTLFQDPDLRTQVTSDWNLLSPFIDEVLRHSSPIQIAKPRYVIDDFEFHGKMLSRKEMIIPFLASANYDPDRFDSPDQFILNRDQNFHTSFGYGPHTCLGMKLAKAETSVAIRTLFEKHPNLGPSFTLDKPDWSNRLGMRGLNTLLASADQSFST